MKCIFIDDGKRCNVEFVGEGNYCATHRPRKKSDQTLYADRGSNKTWSGEVLYNAVDLLKGNKKL